MSAMSMVGVNGYNVGATSIQSSIPWSRLEMPTPVIVKEPPPTIDQMVASALSRLRVSLEANVEWEKKKVREGFDTLRKETVERHLKMPRDHYLSTIIKDRLANKAQHFSTLLQLLEVQARPVHFVEPTWQPAERFQAQSRLNRENNTLTHLPVIPGTVFAKGHAHGKAFPVTKGILE